jgi:CRP-like cAMP-binding protein
MSQRLPKPWAQNLGVQGGSLVDACRDIAEKLMGVGHPMLAPRASVLFTSGDTSEGAYLITSGAVALALMNEDGVTLWTRRLAPGSVFGLAAAISGNSQVLCAVTDEDSSLVFIERETLLHSMRTDTALGNEILRQMSLELIDVRRKMAMLNGKPPQPLHGC